VRVHVLSLQSPARQPFLLDRNSMPRLAVWFLIAAVAECAQPSFAQGKEGKGGKDVQLKKPPVTVETGESMLGASTWKPGFDYTHLMPSSASLWAKITQGPVEMEAALTVAAEALGQVIWLKKGALEDHEGQPAWSLQVFAASSDSVEAPRRVDLLVSTLEPKVLARTDLPEIPEPERQMWNRLAKATVQAEGAITICKVNSLGHKESPSMTQPHLRIVEFVDHPTVPYWTCEMMGLQGDGPRRYGLEIRASGGLRQKILLDRFPGTPLRRAEAVELPNGMFVHDFVTGDGPAVKPDSMVTVHYRLFLLDNSKLHDTWRSGIAETFKVAQAPLKGMTEGLLGMRMGGKRKIAMPYELAFGEAGNEIAPPKAMVVCDIVIEEVL
jgi:peptidylprolyl isomerase